MQQNNAISNFMAFISVTMQIAIIEAFRSEANKRKEFAWPIKQRSFLKCSCLAKRSFCLFLNAIRADSAAPRKKLNKKSTNKRIIKVSESIKRSSITKGHSSYTNNKGGRVESTEKGQVTKSIGTIKILAKSFLPCN